MASRRLDTDPHLEEHSDRASRSRLVQLRPRAVEKPWGRRDIARRFGIRAASGRAIGEIWFEGHEGDGLGDQLLVKYLFTEAPLSVQVHPDDDDARAWGHARGKDEAW